MDEEVARARRCLLLYVECPDWGDTEPETIADIIKGSDFNRVVNVKVDMKLDLTMRFETFIALFEQMVRALRSAICRERYRHELDAAAREKIATLGGIRA